jgi:hypothetical protein
LSKAANRRQKRKREGKPDEEIISLDDERLKICEFCGKPVLYDSGYQGYSGYTTTKYGKDKVKSTKTRKHYDGNSGCFKKWLDKKTEEGWD